MWNDTDLRRLHDEKADAYQERLHTTAYITKLALQGSLDKVRPPNRHLLGMHVMLCCNTCVHT